MLYIAKFNEMGSWIVTLSSKSILDSDFEYYSKVVHRGVQEGSADREVTHLANILLNSGCEFTVEE